MKTRTLVIIAGKLQRPEILSDLERLTKLENDMEIVRAKQATLQEMLDSIRQDGQHGSKMEKDLMFKINSLDDTTARLAQQAEKVRSEAVEELKHIALEKEVEKAAAQTGTNARGLIKTILNKDGINFQSDSEGNYFVTSKGKLLTTRLEEMKADPETSILFNKQESNSRAETRITNQVNKQISPVDRKEIMDYLKYKGNPFKKESHNLTMQGKLVRLMPEKAEELREAAKYA
ncbi:hypothetical protein [Limisalsivibrio acetivorans]|uniref:hypothetical protein n=1 Tax=Limisalsivibrio acetivorans TaxID=1304888 RepID=UPI0003B30285|nr:hypothetical protein [Limisalsivibrio acetivorans]